MFVSYLTLVVCFVTPYTLADTCQSNSHADGCSIPLGIHLFYQTEFTPACNRHDICYFCAHHFGKTKADCDTAFHNNMVHICNNLRKRFIFPHTGCLAAALTYYEAVKGFADSHFENPSASWCTENWARGCLP